MGERHQTIAKEVRGKLLKELIINVKKDFNYILGGRERRVSAHSGEEFRETFIDPNFEKYDRITINLEGVLGVPVEFIDEVFGSVARRYGKEMTLKKFNFLAPNDFTIEKILFNINQEG